MASSSSSIVHTVSGLLAALDPAAMNLPENCIARKDLERVRALVDAKHEQLLQASNAAAGPAYLLCTKSEYIASGGDMRGNRLAVGWLYELDSDVVKAEGCVTHLWRKEENMLLVILSGEQHPDKVRLPAAAWPFAKLVRVTQ
jgi:hypothetical protein